ncbi:PEP-utilizing enzyme [Patescibacteria group bacterium]
MYISKTSEKVLALLFENNNNPLFINEIIRKTGLYPNAIQRSLKTLEKQNIVISERRLNRRFYSLNKNHKHYVEFEKIATKSSSKNTYKYLKWVNRECSVALNTAIGSAQCTPKYIKRFRIPPVEFLWYNSVTGGVYQSFEQITKTAEVISKEVKKDSTFAKDLADRCREDGEELIAETQKTTRLDLPNLTEKQLHSALNKIHELFLHFMPYYVIPHAIEKAIESELGERILDREVKEKLIEPVSIISDEQVDELELASLVKKGGWTQKNKRKLSTLTKKYCWLPMMALHHKPFNSTHFKKIIGELVVSMKNPKKELLKLQEQEKEREEDLENTLNNIEADEELRNLVSITQSYLSLRTYRVNITKKFHYYHLPLLNEISKRIGIKQEDIAFLTYPEILESLKDNKRRKKLNQLINKRRVGFVNITWKGKTRVISGVKDIIQAIEQYNIRAEDPTIRKVVKGNPACRGKVTGTVKVVKKLSELEKVTKGDILVARMTTPDYMIAINRAAAIVTDEGGITCHAAIVSREYNLPCIVGTRNATHILGDGDLVEVDADEGIVRVVETADLPENIKEIFGKTIYKGKVRGTARVILDISDFGNLQKGDIVIAAQTTPEYLSLLYRAKGFVVDEESISSHAVLYGNALKIPSIMGTSYARNVIEDGEKVELDATKGVLKRLG